MLGTKKQNLVMGTWAVACDLKRLWYYGRCRCFPAQISTLLYQSLVLLIQLTELRHNLASSMSVSYSRLF